MIIKVKRFGCILVFLEEPGTWSLVRAAYPDIFSMVNFGCFKPMEARKSNTS